MMMIMKLQIKLLQNLVRLPKYGPLPSSELENSSSLKSVPVISTPISEEANDDDHETSDQVTIEPHRSTRVRSVAEWYGNPVLEVMLLDHDEPMNYKEAMMSQDSAKWLKAMKSEMGSMYKEQNMAFD